MRYLRNDGFAQQRLQLNQDVKARLLSSLCRLIEQNYLHRTQCHLHTQSKARRLRGRFYLVSKIERGKIKQTLNLFIQTQTFLLIAHEIPCILYCFIPMCFFFV